MASRSRARPAGQRATTWSWLLALAPYATIGLAFVGPAGGARLGFLLASALSALWLYLRHPAMYVGSVWWLWFLAPWARRVIDYAGGWDEVSPVLLAPLAATLVSAITVLRYLPRLRRRTLYPLAVVVLGILIAYPVGVARAGVPAATYALLLYLAPLCFGFHLAVHAERYAAYRGTIQTVFAAGVLVMGVYGLVQFLLVPPWDRYWMVSSAMPTIGYPEPGLVRVFSTLNSPNPFGLVMAVGLLLLFTARAPVQWLAGVPGYLALLLSLVRTAWLLWLIGVLFYAASLRHRTRIRVAASACVLLLLLLPLAGGSAFGEAIATRLSTFRELTEDSSYQMRLEIYRRFSQAILDNPLGEGLGWVGAGAQLNEENYGLQHFDSGILEVMLNLGWPGSLLLLTGLGLVVWPFARPGRRINDPLYQVSRGVVLGLPATMLALNPLTGLAGMLFWTFAGLGIAARQAHLATAPVPAPAPVILHPAWRS